MLCGALCAATFLGCAGGSENGSGSGGEPQSSVEHTHAFGEWELVKAASCTKEGEKQRTCSCGEVQTEKVAKTEHVYNLAHLCLSCGVVDSNFIAPSTQYLVKDGASEYIIVYQAKNIAIKEAAEQLQAYFERATGVKLRALEYSGAHIPTGKYFFLGEEPAKAAGLSFAELKGNASYAIQTKGKAVYIYGAEGVGVQNGVGAYLRDMLNHSVYYQDVTDVIKASTIPFTEISKTGSAYFEYLFSGYGELTANREYERAMGFTTDYTVSGGGIHNATNIISREKYGASHPEWFYEGTTADGYNTGTQLYLAAENFEAGANTLVSTVANALYTMIKNNGHLSIFGFSPMDIDIWPTGAGYENADALKETYGTNVAEYIMFMNAVAKEIEKKGLDRKIQLQLLAYNKTLCAPVLDGLSEEEKEKIMLYQGEQVCVVPYVAPVEANYSMALDDERNLVKNPLTGAFDEGSLTVAEVIRNWGELTDKIHFWWYSLDAYSYFMPMDTITNMQKVYQFAYENKVTLIFNQCQFDTPVSTDWARLKIYLQSELSRNPYADTDGLIDNFMNAYFGVAAPHMKELLKDEQAWYAILLENSLTHVGYYWLGTLRSSAWCTQDILNALQWTMTMSGSSPDMLYAWMGRIESAKNAVEADDALTAEEKEILYERIDLEALPARWVLVKVFGETRYDDDLDAFYRYAQTLGVTKKGEGQPIT